MSTRPTWTVFCDGADCLRWHEDCRDRSSAPAAAAEARRDGWLVVGALALCDICRKRLQTDEVPRV